MSTFIDELSRLNTQNFLGGLAQYAEEANKYATKKKIDVITSEFNKNLNDIKSSTEQLANLNAINKSVGETEEEQITEQASRFTEMLFNASKMSMGIDTAFDSAMVSLVALGEQAYPAINALKEAKESAKKNLDQMTQIPISVMQFQDAKLSIANKLLSNEESEFRIKKLYEDENTRQGVIELNKRLLQDADWVKFSEWAVGIKAGGTTHWDNPEVSKTYNTLVSKYNKEEFFPYVLDSLQQRMNFRQLQVFSPNQTGESRDWWKNDSIYGTFKGSKSALTDYETLVRMTQFYNSWNNPSDANMKAAKRYVEANRELLFNSTDNLQTLLSNDTDINAVVKANIMKYVELESNKEDGYGATYQRLKRVIEGQKVPKETGGYYSIYDKPQFYYEDRYLMDFNKILHVGEDGSFISVPGTKPKTEKKSETPKSVFKPIGEGK